MRLLSKTFIFNLSLKFYTSIEGLRCDCGGVNKLWNDVKKILVLLLERLTHFLPWAWILFLKARLAFSGLPPVKISAYSWFVLRKTVCAVYGDAVVTLFTPVVMLNHRGKHTPTYGIYGADAITEPVRWEKCLLLTYRNTLLLNNT